MALHSHDPKALSALMAVQAAHGFGYRNALYRGALAGDFRVVELLPRARVPQHLLRDRCPNTVIVVGDDAGISSGPADFPQAIQLLRWAQRVMVHAAGGAEQHYALAAAAARQCRRVLVIETRTKAEPAWMALAEAEHDRRVAAGLPLLRVLLIQVPGDQPAHPIEGGAA